MTMVSLSLQTLERNKKYDQIVNVANIGTYERDRKCGLATSTAN